MKGLLLKYLKNILPTIGYYAFFMVVFYVVCILSKNIIYFSSVCVVLGISVPTSAYVVDEKDNWDKFVLAAGMKKIRSCAAGICFPLCCCFRFGFYRQY